MKEVQVVRKGFVIFQIVDLVKAINARVCSAFSNVFRGNDFAIANETSS